MAFTRFARLPALLLIPGLLAACGEEARPCASGHEGCPCFPNQTCLNDLVCGVAGRCERPARDAGLPDAAPGDAAGDAGVEPPACDLDGDCDATPLTAGRLCVAGHCVACEADRDCVTSFHYGDLARCDAEGRCERIPSCAEDGCPEGGVCDALSGTCRAPRTCDAAACVPFQACQAPTADADATCLAECEPGYRWNGVDATCVAIPPNCRPDWANSVLADCAARQRACVELEDAAACGECFLGYREDATGCVSVQTCGQLDCAAAGRLCVAETAHADAWCGACRAGLVERFGQCQGAAGATCDPSSSGSILAECTGARRTCLTLGSTAACGDCLAGFAEDPATGLCETVRACSDLDCAAQHRSCTVTWNAGCTGCLAGYEEDPATGACVCAAGTLPGPTDECETIVTCADIGAACTSVGELCVAATATSHAECRHCLEDEAWYDFWQACVPCPPCTKAGETGRVHPITSRMGHCVCETQPGYYHSESGLGGTFACDRDGDGWVTTAARVPLEAPEGTAERDNARCTLRLIDRFVLVNEAGESREVPLSDFDFLAGAVPLYEPENRDRAERLQNDLDYANPNLANYAPALGGGRALTAAEMNPLTKACPTAVGDPNARHADYNANGVADVDELGAQDERSDPEARIFSRFSFFLELHRGWFEQPSGEPFGRWVIRERSRSPYAAPGWSVPLRYPEGPGHWRTCHRFRDSAYDPEGPPYGMDFAGYGADADCALDGGPGSWCGMNHHSQFRCLLVETAADLDPELPHHVAAGTVSRDYEANQCTPAGVQDPVTASGANAIDPEWSCAVAPVPPAGQAVWGAARYQDYGDTKAPNPTYVRGCINECAEQERLPQEQRCQGASGPPPILCDGQESDFGRLFCYRAIDWTAVSVKGQGFYMGSPDGLTCPPWNPACPSPAATAEPGRDPGEVLHRVDFSDDEYPDLVVTRTEITQDQFLDFMGYNPSRFTCDGSVCPVEQVNFFEALALANVMSDRLGYDRCYDFETMRCADGTSEELWDTGFDPPVYLGQYCRDHGGIDEIQDLPHDLSYKDRYYDHWSSGMWVSHQCEGFRLPTEAEWEFLARADTHTAFYFGSNDPAALDCQLDPGLDTAGWYCGNSSFRTAASGVKLANAFGLYDVGGNVWEWVIDSFYVYSGAPAGDPEHSSDLSWNGLRIARGGAWNRDARDARSARRVAYPETTRNPAVGFRLVRSRYDYDRYVAVFSEVGWQAAEDDCQSRGGHLASLNDWQEHVRAWRRMAQDGITSTTRFWIGLTDAGHEGAWTWSDGSTATAGNRWATGEPNGGAGQNCVYMRADPGDTSIGQAWYDWPCDQAPPSPAAYLCELPLAIP